MNTDLPVEWWRPQARHLGGDRSGVSTATDVETADSSVPFLALLAYTFVVLLAPQTFFPALRVFRVALLTAALAIVTHLFNRFVHGLPIGKPTREIWITAALVAWAVLTLPLSYWPGGSASVLLDLYLKSVATFWMLANIVNTPSRLWRVTWALALIGVPLALTGASNFFSGAFMDGGRGVTRIVGYEAPLTGNPNDLALTLNLILPLTVALFLATRNRALRAVLLVMAAIQVVGVVITFSRGGFLALATTSMVYAWKLLRDGRGGWVVVLVLIALAGIPFLPAGYLERMGTIVDSESDSTWSAQTRRQDMMAAARFVLTHPIVGAGIGMNTLALNDERGSTWTPVHNVYLEYAMELGIPGLLMFLLLFSSALGNTRFVRKALADHPSTPPLFHLAGGIQASLIAFGVSALFHPVGYHFYFYYPAGLAVALKLVHDQSGERRGIEEARQ